MVVMTRARGYGFITNEDISVGPSSEGNILVVALSNALKRLPPSIPDGRFPFREAMSDTVS